MAPLEEGWKEQKFKNDKEYFHANRTRMKCPI